MLGPQVYLGQLIGNSEDHRQECVLYTVSTVKGFFDKKHGDRAEVGKRQNKSSGPVNRVHRTAMLSWGHSAA